MRWVFFQLHYDGNRWNSENRVFQFSGLWCWLQQDTLCVCVCVCVCVLSVCVVDACEVRVLNSERARIYQWLFLMFMGTKIFSHCNTSNSCWSLLVSFLYSTFPFSSHVLLLKKFVSLNAHFLLGNSSASSFRQKFITASPSHSFGWNMYISR